MCPFTLYKFCGTTLVWPKACIIPDKWGLCPEGNNNQMSQNNTDQKYQGIDITHSDSHKHKGYLQTGIQRRRQNRPQNNLGGLATAFRITSFISQLLLNLSFNSKPINLTKLLNSTIFYYGNKIKRLTKFSFRDCCAEPHSYTYH